ncbi:MAG TPA: fibronectin type III domain-containing protein, partial [Candidatus Acidoferrum sp.]|nr:fibronectin type III domain-containing protein [Candidatus Acidoferrum sp.]
MELGSPIVQRIPMGIVRCRTSVFAILLLFAWLLPMGCSNNSSTPPPDTTPPSAPTALTATAASSSQINLSWTASTDNVGVTGYRVERCQGASCSNFSQIATPPGTSYDDTGLTASTPYSYRVRATDAAGNLSSYSSVATATTLANNTNISVTISPKRGGLTITQALSVTATVTGDSSNQGATWSATGGGSFSSSSSASGTPVTYTAPGTAGSVTITATSKADVSKSASATI